MHVHTIYVPILLEFLWGPLSLKGTKRHNIYKKKMEKPPSITIDSPLKLLSFIGKIREVLEAIDSTLYLSLY